MRGRNPYKDFDWEAQEHPIDVYLLRLDEPQSRTRDLESDVNNARDYADRRSSAAGVDWAEAFATDVAERLCR